MKDVLFEKHPKPQALLEHILINNELLSINPVLFEQLTPDLVKAIRWHAQGTARLYGLDAKASKRMLTCFKKSSD